jgi:hypothetical protein
MFHINYTGRWRCLTNIIASFAVFACSSAQRRNSNGLQTQLLRKTCALRLQPRQSDKKSLFALQTTAIAYENTQENHQQVEKIA